MAMTLAEDERFTAFLREKALESNRAVNYYPGDFLKMLGSLGGYRAAVTLLTNPVPSLGFTKLWERGRLDLSVEALVAQGPWRANFDKELLRVADKRLAQAGYLPKQPTSHEVQAVGPEVLPGPAMASGPPAVGELVPAAGSSTSATKDVSVLPFILGNQYTRADVFKILSLEPVPNGGPWFTGYTEHKGNSFIFCNVGSPGRTGHDYNNHFEGDRLVWFGKGPSRISHASIQRLILPDGLVYVFFRSDDRDPFTFAGTARPHKVFDTQPVKVVWDFFLPTHTSSDYEGEMQEGGATTVIEGATKIKTVKVYERDRGARLKCVAKWGWKCFACEFDFSEAYGALGENFIHVHHLKPLAEIGEQYELDPVADLRPVCPNCHAMLHRKVPALSIDTLKTHLKKTALQ